MARSVRSKVFKGQKPSAKAHNRKYKKLVPKYGRKPKKSRRIKEE